MIPFQTLTIHRFKKSNSGTYLFPVYFRDDGKFKIESTDRFILGTLKRVYVVYDQDGKEVGLFDRLKDAKTVFESVNA